MTIRSNGQYHDALDYAGDDYDDYGGDDDEMIKDLIDFLKSSCVWIDIAHNSSTWWKR